MYRKLMIAMCAAVLLSLLGSGPTFASEGHSPTWETAFDPGLSFGPYYLIHAVEEYQGDLYAVAGDPGWFDFDQECSERQYHLARYFARRMVKNWRAASEPGFELGDPPRRRTDDQYVLIRPLGYDRFPG